MRLSTIHKYRDDNTYNFPSGSTIETVTVNNKTVPLSICTVDYDDNTIVVESKTDITVTYVNNKEKLIGFTPKHIFNYSAKGRVLSPSSKYKLEINIDGTASETFILSTKLEPSLCTVKDVKRLIGVIISSMESSIDIEDYIFDASITIEDKHGDMEVLDKKRLCANMASLSIIYNYYYELVDKIGTLEDSVGTLKVKRQGVAIKLDDLIDRFKDTIDDIISFEDVSVGKSFSKASGTESPLESRLW